MSWRSSCRPSIAWRAAASVDIKELGGETFIAHNVESPYRSRVIQLFEKHRTPLHRDIEMPTIESIKRFVQMGMGVAIVPRMCVTLGSGAQAPGRSPHPAAQDAALSVSCVATRRAPLACGCGADAAIGCVAVK
jgi:DNA-binding transcriptional LysR family regulator